MITPFDKLARLMFPLTAAFKRWRWERKYARRRAEIGLPLRRSKTMRV